MRKRLFEIIELSDGNDRLSRIYDLFMMCIIVTSLIPLAYKETNYLFVFIRLCLWQSLTFWQYYRHLLL